MKYPIIFSTVLTVVIIAICSTILIGQPALPSTPAEAPIDGGLGILAAIGGSYAVKKLREKNKEESY